MMATHNNQIYLLICKELICGAIMLCFGVIDGAMFAFFNICGGRGWGSAF